MTARSWHFLMSLPLWLAPASCVDDDPALEPGAMTQAVAGCTAPATSTGVCNVGVSSGGSFAVQYGSAWWSLDFASGYWAVENNVSATPIDVVPTQTITSYNPCDSVCNSCGNSTGSARFWCEQACNSCRASSPPTSRTESLKYRVAVNGQTYSLEAYETSMDTRAQSADQALEIRSQRSMEFRIGLLDPEDGNPWTVSVLPKRLTSTPPSATPITVVAGTYGGNAGAPHGNVTAALASECSGKTSCTYTVLLSALCDPAPGAAKDYVAEWSCGPQLLRTSAVQEAGFGSIVNLSCGQEAINEAVTDGAIATGTLGSLVSNGNTSYASEVELHGAVKSGATSSPELVARSNPALNRALDTALPAGGAFQQHYIPEAIQSLGNVSHVTPKGSATGLYDMTRFNQFYLDNRKGSAGWSTQGSGEQPQAESGPRTWSWRHKVFDYSVQFPFLAGICGLEAGVHSYIAGSLTYGRESCFDGLATTIDAEGQLQFNAGAFGGLGCNILVASASAGLESTISAGFEFKTHLQTAPPMLTGAVDIYSNLDFHGYFRVRVLFWSKKWEKTIVQARLFHKHTEYSLAPTLPDPGKQLCNTDSVPRGTCSDPLASCDVDGRCVRYDFTSTEPTAPPVRVDTGACLAPGGDTSFSFAIEGRQYIPNEVPGLPAIPGKICGSSPTAAIDAWLHQNGLPPSATVNTWEEPRLWGMGTQRFSGNDRYADTRPDRLRKTGLRWVGVMRASGSGPATIETAAWEPSHSWSLRFDGTGCLIDARDAPVKLTDHDRALLPPNSVSKRVQGSYPFYATPDIYQVLALSKATVSESSLRFKLFVQHTDFPWHETILTWKGKAYGLRDWGSTCSGPSFAAFWNVTAQELDVELRDDPRDPQVFVGGVRVMPDTFPPRVTGPADNIRC